MAKKNDYAQQFEAMLDMIEPQMRDKFSEIELEYMKKPVGITMIDSDKTEGIDIRSLTKKVNNLDLAGKLWMKNYIAA